MTELDKHSNGGSIFHRTACLTLEQLTAYAEDRVSDEERFTIEKHLVDCKLCSDALDGYALLEETSHLKDRVTSMDELIRERASSAVRHKRSWQLYYSLAASIVLACAAVLYLRHHAPSYDSLYAEYFKPYPNAVPLLRGEGPGGILESAMIEYESENYGAALTSLKTVLMHEPTNDTANFYAGISSMCLNDPQTAVPFFQNVSERSGLTDQTIWYQGLAYLKQNDIDAAKRCFESLSLKEGSFRQRCIELLNRLK